MSDFIRARSSEQKQERMNEIKTAVEALFAEKPYHEITLTSIAEKLNWTRVNLYKYVSTKEEIFLEIFTDKRNAYYDALKSAFPKNCGYSKEVIAQVWAGILNAHQDQLHYGDILSSIIETNVSLDRLAAFKKNYYESAYAVTDLLAEHLGISSDVAYRMFLNVYYHSIGIYSLCRWNPMIVEALKKENLTPPEIDFREDMTEFILMNINHYCNKSK